MPRAHRGPKRTSAGFHCKQGLQGVAQGRGPSRTGTHTIFISWVAPEVLSLACLGNDSEPRVGIKIIIS